MVSNYTPIISANEMWKTVTVGDLFEVVTDTVNPANETGTVSYIGLENIESGTGKIIGKLECDINTIKSTKRVFKNTDILFGKLRPALNKVAFPNKNGVWSTDIIVLRSKSKDRRSTGRATRATTSPARARRPMPWGSPTPSAPGRSRR